MGVFRVMLKAEGLRATFDGKEVDCGFFKNEFVWAEDRDQAIHKARVKVESALRRKATVNQEDLVNLRIEIEEVEADVGITNLFQRQGFAFHKLGDHDTKG